MHAVKCYLFHIYTTYAMLMMCFYSLDLRKNVSQCFVRLTRCKYLICIIVGDEYVSVYGEKKP